MWPGNAAAACLTSAGFFHRDGAEDHAFQTLVEPALDRRHIADAAAKLRRDGAAFQDRLDRRGVHRLSGESAVEVHQVQPFAPSGNEGLGLRGRVFVEHGGLLHIPLEQAHGLPILEVNCGVKDHSRPPGLWSCRALA
jgi:hypothetical protein